MKNICRIVVAVLAVSNFLSIIPSSFAAENAFQDVSDTDYFCTAVNWAVENNITKGMTESTFEPNLACTRAQMITFLWRKAGCPEPGETDNPFNDIKEGDYYYSAVLWGVERKITNGMDKDKFCPNGTVTRAQSITMLYRYSKLDFTKQAENPFNDVKEKDYFYKAVLWAFDSKITKGISEKDFAPDLDCTRGQIVTFLYRYDINKPVIRIAVVGDSLSDYYKAFDTSGKMSDTKSGHVYPAEDVNMACKMWYNVLASELNSVQDTYNYRVTAVDAISGSMVCAECEMMYGYVGIGWQMWSDSRLAKLKLGGEPDIIIVEGGSNDFLHQNDMVYKTDLSTKVSLDVDVFKENYVHYMDRIKEEYANARVICLSIYGIGINKDDEFIDVVLKAAADHGYESVNMKNVINKDNYTSMTISDRSHMNTKGQKEYAMEIYNQCFGSTYGPVSK